MTTAEGSAPEPGQETGGLRPESSGGAGMGEEGAPIGFAAEVGGTEAPSTDDPEEVRRFTPAASHEGPTTASERAERGEPDEEDRTD